MAVQSLIEETVNKLMKKYRVLKAAHIKDHTYLDYQGTNTYFIEHIEKTVAEMRSKIESLRIEINYIDIPYK